MKELRDAIFTMIGADGAERLGAIARLLPADHRFRDPELLAVHLLDIGIEHIEQVVASTIGISRVETVNNKESK